MELAAADRVSVADTESPSCAAEDRMLFCRAYEMKHYDTSVTVQAASSGVARICCEEGQRLKLCHGAFAVDFRAGCSSCSMTNSFVTNAVGRKSRELLTSASANLADYTILR